MNVLYTAEATARGGREGRVRSSDGALNLELSIPKELGGPGGVATNPEQLFAAGSLPVSRMRSDWWRVAGECRSGTRRSPPG